MSVTNQDNKVTYTGNGSLAVYPVPFYFAENSHLKVYIDDELKTISTDYTVTGADDEDGGELTFLVAPVNTSSIVILRDVPLTQPNTFSEGSPFQAQTLERMFDRLTHIDQQTNEKINRAIKMPLDSDTLDPQITGDVVPGAIIVVNPAGDGLEMGLSISEYNAQLDAKVTAAQLAETNAETAETNAETAQAAAETARDAAQLAETNAETAEVNAEAAQAAAEAAAIAAQQAVSATAWQDVIFVSSGDSPLTVDDTYSGVMLSCDCSGGPIVINLPAISSLSLGLPWTLGIKKSDSSGNSVTVNRNGTDLIDGGASKTLGSASAGAVFIPDTDGTPDKWTTAEFGASAGNITTDRFSGNGSQTAFTLSVDPGSENNTQVFINGVYQQKDTYSISGTTLTFDEAPVVGTNNIEVNSGTSLPVGTPADASVTSSKLAPSVASALLPPGVILEYAGTTAPTGFLMCNGQSVSRSTYAALFAAIGTAHGTLDGSSFNVPDRRGNFARGYMDINTVSGSGSAASNNATFTAHGINRTGFKVRLSSGTLTGLAASTDYFAIVVDANTLAFATSHANAIAGTKIAISGVNSAVIVQWEDPDRATRLQSAVGGNTATGVGARQADEIKSHIHSITNYNAYNPSAALGGSGNNTTGTFNYNTNATGGNETRPNGVAMNFIIKT